MRKLVSPAKPGDKSCNELVKLLKDHFSPKPSKTVQCYTFNSRKPGESVMEYVAVLTVNQMARPEQYAIPRIEDLFARLSGGQKFTKLNLSHAYYQIPLEEAKSM